MKHLGAEAARWAHNPKVVGSKPTDARREFPLTLTQSQKSGAVAQLVERPHSVRKVVGSKPSSSIKIKKTVFCLFFLFFIFYIFIFL